MIKLKTLSFLAIFSLATIFNTASAQFGGLLNKVKDEVVDKVEDRVTDAIAERIANEIANRAVRSVNSVMDSIFKEKYEKDTLNFEGLSRSYEDFLGAMNEAANLPAAYNFDMTLEIEMTDYDGEKNKMNMLLSKTEGIFGVEQIDKKNKSNLVIIDLDNDIVSIYDEKAKTVQALPNMMMLGKGLAQTSMEETYTEFNFERTSQTKKVAGYQTVLYKSSTEEEDTDSYLAESFPITYENTFKKFGQDFIPQYYLDQMEEAKGFMLLSESEFKSTNKKSKWETKKVKEESIKIDNSKYTKSSMTGQ